MDDADGKFKEAVELLEMCSTCDLMYSVSHAIGIYPDGEGLSRTVADVVREFLEKHSPNS